MSKQVVGPKSAKNPTRFTLLGHGEVVKANDHFRTTEGKVMRCPPLAVGITLGHGLETQWLRPLKGGRKA